MKHLTLGRLWIAFVAVLPACMTGDETPRQNLATVAPNLVSLSATEYAFQAPDTLPAGWTTFRLANLGEEVHCGSAAQAAPFRAIPPA